MRQLLTAQRLRERLHYDPESGFFFRRYGRGRRGADGHVGCLTSDGYRYIGVDYIRYSAHRLAWLYVTGKWPVGYIDHINRHRNDNRIANLRDVSAFVNIHNRGTPNGPLSRGGVPDPLTFFVSNRRKDGPSIDEIRSMLAYDGESGLFKWRISTRGSQAGDLAGWIDPNGYVHVRICGKLYLAHRLAWMSVFGKWPAKNLDHINGIPGDNRIANLRETDQAGNTSNSKKSKANTSGFKGVSRKRGKWRAYITVHRHQINLGVYDTAEAAAHARNEAAPRYHGEFARAS